MKETVDEQISIQINRIYSRTQNKQEKMIQIKNIQISLKRLLYSPELFSLFGNDNGIDYSNRQTITIENMRLNMVRNDYCVLMGLLYNNILWDDFQDRIFIAQFQPKGQDQQIYILNSEINLFRESENQSLVRFGSIQYQGLKLTLLKTVLNQKSIEMQIIGLTIS